MVKLIAITAIAVTLLSSSVAAQQPADSYLALREHFETQLGRELDPFEARDVAYLAERGWKEKLAKKAAEKLKKHHKKVGDPSGGSQEENRRELAGSFYAREYDFETPTTRELSEAQSLYGRNFADFIHKFFHPYGDLKGAKKDEKKEEPKEGAKTEDAPAPDAVQRSLYADSMDVMTRSYYGFGDMD
ncbi:hypothetical protein D9619_013483 [Psilocybe cf. subviscida]|uniref:Uncharacterized protein n=1 Tax=Psilocybe cf. subviscida TaxID=2480587 RepID=A0A8H5BH56_9AGAR|nr:hypothetical protein D9619_013483 [Psilocybe cf. subviscida]